MDWRKFRPEQVKPSQKAGNPTPEPQPEHITSLKSEHSDHPNNNVILHVEPLPKIEVSKTKRIEHTKTWEQDITELESYFAGISLPTLPMKLNSFFTVTDVSSFIESHFLIVKANIRKRTFIPYLNRLQELKEYLSFTNLPNH
jgi:sulfite reductase alpha subunit-like flavoprotein